MPWLIDDDLYYAVSGGEGIFLDLSAQRYFALSTDADRVVRDALSRGSALDIAVASLNLPGRAKPRQSAVLNIPGPTAAPREAQPRIDLMLRLWSLERAIARELRTQSLRAVMHRLECAAGDPAVDPVRLARVAASARLLNRFRTAYDLCLARSVALARLCHALRLPAIVVLAVTARPFAAHAWTQCGPVLLNDDIDHVRQFSPIAAWPCKIAAS